MTNPHYIVYTDGACSGNPGPGGWAAIIKKENGQTEEYSGGFSHTTNNRMELIAVIKSLELLAPEAHISLHSDSQYIVKAFTDKWIAGWQRNGWRTSQKKPVANRDLWEKLVALVSERSVTWVWVRGHDVDGLNNRCDELAVQASQTPNLPVDLGYTQTHEKLF